MTLFYTDRRERLKGGPKWESTVFPQGNPSWISWSLLLMSTLFLFLPLALHHSAVQHCRSHVVASNDSDHQSFPQVCHSHFKGRKSDLHSIWEPLIQRTFISMAANTISEIFRPLFWPSDWALIYILQYFGMKPP